MRCVKCGNEVNKEDFVCIYCNARLREEKIEKIPYFRRVTDEKWTSPIKGWNRFYLVLRNPSRAFWDIVHYRENIGSWFKVYFLSAVIYGLFGLALFVHVRTGFTIYSRILNGLSAYMLFFLFGLVYFFLFYMISIQLFSIGANYSINLKSQLKLRYGERKSKKEDEEKTTTMLEAEGIYPTALPSHLTAQKSKKISIMLWGFTPFLIALALSAIVLIISGGLSSQTINSAGELPAVLASFAQSIVWGITDWIQVIVLIGAVPITMSIALRELVNASTFRVYVSCLIVSLLLGLVLYFFRPSFLFNMI
ncbi:MAG: hypothetical protein JW776_06190 [Candidatus Lokiarchaeota archaeon]|nr:hypothetical protein [Candidatus Lokiarchaeota archaeon]